MPNPIPNKYISVKEIEGKKYIAVGKPSAMMDVLFTEAEAYDMFKELESALPPATTTPQWGGGNVPT